MSLYDKIMAIYPELTIADFDTYRDGTIELCNNTGEQADDYIAKWEHPTLAQPTQEQLDAVGEA